jgi:hypothetical protein
LLEEIFSFKEISIATSHLLYQIKHHSQYLNTEATGWVLEIDQQFRADKSVGLKFIGHIAAMMKEEGVIEKNSPLQKGSADAANHFEIRLA